MGNSNAPSNSIPDPINTSISLNNATFKVDNINSNGRKHASAKIHLSNNNMCIQQKHRQSLHIPLEAIKRYGLDGSIFILECGRRAPLGPARYAFRCKQAHRLVNSLDQRITMISEQLSQQTRQEILTLSSTTSHRLPSIGQQQQQQQQRQRTQSDQDITHQVPSLTLTSSTSSSSSSLSSSLNSNRKYLFHNSEPNLSENYLAFNTSSCRTENMDGNRSTCEFMARLKQPLDKQPTLDLNYIELKAENSPMLTTSDQGS
jgi:hypothetical protein